jgi:HAMP domain-containing protein
MSTGNSWVDGQIAAAAASLAAQWKNNPRAVQPENALKPDSAALQFRIKILEDRVHELETLFNEMVRYVRQPR